MARADQPLHLHVLAGEIEDRGIAALLHPDGVARVGDDFAFERHAHALLRGLRIDAMIRVLLVTGCRITSRRFHRNIRILPETIYSAAGGRHTFPPLIWFTVVHIT